MKPAKSFIGQPIRSLQTMLRVIAEDRPGYVTIIPDGIYGPETVSAVAAFQRSHGIPVTGVANQETWEQIVAEYEPALTSQQNAQPLYVILNPGQVIRPGERHPNLYLAQSMLTVLADTYASIEAPAINGLLDKSTEDALISFQQLSGLPATGHLDKNTWKHLTLHYPLAANRWQNIDIGL